MKSEKMAKAQESLEQIMDTIKPYLHKLDSSDLDQQANDWHLTKNNKTCDSQTSQAESQSAGFICR